MRKFKLSFYIVCFLSLSLSTPILAQEKSTKRLIEAIAAIEAEILVRDFHLVKTPENDKQKTLEKLRELELQKQQLKTNLNIEQNRQIARQVASQRKNLIETFSFSDKYEHKCKFNDDSELCLSNGIRMVLEKVVEAFASSTDEAPQLPKQIKERGSITLSSSQKIKYTTLYEVAFSEDGLVNYLLDISGVLTKSPSQIELRELQSTVRKEINLKDEDKIHQLAMQYRVLLMKDDSLIEKSKKKKRIIGSF